MKDEGKGQVGGKSTGRRRHLGFSVSKLRTHGHKNLAVRNKKRNYVTWKLPNKTHGEGRILRHGDTGTERRKSTVCPAPKIARKWCGIVRNKPANLFPSFSTKDDRGGGLPTSPWGIRHLRCGTDQYPPFQKSWESNHIGGERL